MKALHFSGKRLVGAVVVCLGLALPALAPVAARAGSLGPASVHAPTTLYAVPKRCQWILTEIENLSPADFPSQQAFQAALRALLSQLHACEARH